MEDYSHVRTSLPETVRQAAEVHEREYHDFLDRKRGHYRSVADILGKGRSRRCGR